MENLRAELSLYKELVEKADFVIDEQKERIEKLERELNDTRKAFSELAEENDDMELRQIPELQELLRLANEKIASLTK